MNKKFLVFDMDGTILTKENKILPDTIDALKKIKSLGHILAIATGRPYFFVKKIKGSELFDYLICTNGAYYINTKTNNITAKHFLPEYIIDDFAKMAKETNTYLFLNDLNNSVASSFSGDKHETKKVLVDWGGIKIVDIKKIYNYVDKSKITQATILATPNKVSDLKKRMEKYSNEIELRIGSEKYLDANPANVSKYSAIQEIADKVNIENKNIIAFGDSGNDIEMLKGVGLGIAMGNSTEDAINASDKTIGTNESSAIAETIMELIKE